MGPLSDPEVIRLVSRNFVPVAVNLSARNLLDPQLVDQIGGLLQGNGVAAQLLQVELTESAVMADPVRASEILRSLAGRGIGLAVAATAVVFALLTYAASRIVEGARKAIDRKTGARGLRSIMEGILLDTMFDLPSLEGVEEVVISKEVVEGTARPLYIYADRSDRANDTSASA